MVGQLSDTQINNILCSQVVGRLACTDGKVPYIVPVTFFYDGNYIYGQTNEGTKLEILRKNPNVCFETDVVTDMWNWQSVVAHGKFEELTKEEAEQARSLLFNRVFALLTTSNVHTHEHEVMTELDDSRRVKFVMYRIKIHKITARFEKQ